MKPHDALHAAALEILEEGLFLFLDPSDDEAVEGVTFQMRIEGDATAAIGLRMDHPVALKLASDMLGIEPDEVTGDDALAAVSEALNMVAGAVVTSILGEDAVLELCPPTAGGEPMGDLVTFETDDGHVQLWYAA